MDGWMDGWMDVCLNEGDGDNDVDVMLFVWEWWFEMVIMMVVIKYMGKWCCDLLICVCNDGDFDDGLNDVAGLTMDRW